jgi:molybdenum cofactor biosynthesis enzyme MoaA
MVEPTKFIQKIINGYSFLYDRELDRITCPISKNTSNLSRNSLPQKVDICLEITTACNFYCNNCFCDSTPMKSDSKAPIKFIKKTITDFSSRVIRVCITGGEPFLHPNIREILKIPETVRNCGFIITSNGSLCPDLDSIILQNLWITAISLHGKEESHNSYTKSNSFRSVRDRITKLASKGVVHIYTVVHDILSYDDVDWLFNFRDETGVKFIRFINPRPFGRYQRVKNNNLLEFVRERVDEFSSLTMMASNTIFVDVDGEFRHSH